jgi:hypothetical protein
MSHLTLETLARLIDDAPDPTENGHLDICAQCREELEAMRADVALLHRLPDAEPSPAQWIRLEQRLQREGLMRQQRWQWQPAALRMAAAIVIFVLGGVSAALVMRPLDRQELTAIQAPVQNVTERPATLPNPDVTLANTPSSVAAAPTIAALPPAIRPARTAEEAADRLRAAESDYLTALTRFAELSGRGAEGDPVARLAALESIVATTRAALGRAPADPVINGYHLTAVAQRDAMLRQANTTQQQTWY